MRTTVAATLLAVVGLLAVWVGAGFGSTPHASAKGTLTGGIVFTGRIPPGYANTSYQRGVVQILRRGTVVARAHLA